MRWNERGGSSAPEVALAIGGGRRGERVRASDLGDGRLPSKPRALQSSRMGEFQVISLQSVPSPDRKRNLINTTRCNISFNPHNPLEIASPSPRRTSSPNCLRTEVTVTLRVGGVDLKTGRVGCVGGQGRRGKSVRAGRWAARAEELHEPPASPRSMPIARAAAPRALGRTVL